MQSFNSSQGKQSPVGSDCLLLAEQHIIDQGWETKDELAKWKRDIEEEINTTADRVRREPPPDPEEDDWEALSRAEYREQHTSP